MYLVCVSGKARRLLWSWWKKGVKKSRSVRKEMFLERLNPYTYLLDEEEDALQLVLTLKDLHRDAVKIFHYKEDLSFQDLYEVASRIKPVE